VAALLWQLDLIRAGGHVEAQVSRGLLESEGRSAHFDGILSGEHRGDGVAMAPAEQVAAREPGTRCAICGSP